MREDLVRKYAAELGIVNFRPKTQRGWLETKCPLAPWTHPSGDDHSPSFAILCNADGRSAFACQGCKHKGSFPMLAYKLYGFTGEERYKEIGNEVEQIEINTVANSLPDWDEVFEEADRQINRTYLNEAKAFAQYPPAFYFRPTLDYLRLRGLEPLTAVKLRLRYSFLDDRLMFPVWDRNMELRGFSGRDITGLAELKVKDFSGLNKVELFLGEHIVFRDRLKFRFVIVVEGLLDWAKVRQAGYPNVMAIMGSQITKEKYEKLIDLNLPVVWFMDNDTAGYDALHGRVDPVTEVRDETKGALYMFRNFFPQMVAQYPKHLPKLTDPGSLSSGSIRKAITRAQYIV